MKNLKKNLTKNLKKKSSKHHHISKKRKNRRPKKTHKYDFLSNSSSGSDEENNEREAIHESNSDESSRDKEGSDQEYAFKASINHRSTIAQNKGKKIAYKDEEVEEDRPKAKRHTRHNVPILSKGNNYQQLDYWKGKRYV